MLVGKPHKQGSAQDLDGSDKSKDVVDLTQAQSAELLPAMDDQPFNNPDGASTSLAAKQGVMQVPGNGNPQAGRNASRQGTIHPTGRSTAPASNPFPRPGSPTTRTRTLTAIK